VPRCSLQKPAIPSTKEALPAGPALREAFRAQHEADFSLFLRLRAAEFAPGGLLLVVVPGSLGDGSHAGTASLTFISEAAAEMAAEGRIDAARLMAFLLPVYLPSEHVRMLLLLGMLCFIEARGDPSHLCTCCLHHSDSLSVPVQELDDIASISGSWDVLQRGGAAITQARLHLYSLTLRVA
jgi:hypothetical protein